MDYVFCCRKIPAATFGLGEPSTHHVETCLGEDDGNITLVRFIFGHSYVICGRWIYTCPCNMSSTRFAGEDSTFVRHLNTQNFPTAACCAARIRVARRREGLREPLGA